MTALAPWLITSSVACVVLHATPMRNLVAAVAILSLLPTLAHAQPTPPEGPAASLRRWPGFRIPIPDFDAELQVRGLVQADAAFLVDDRAERPDRFEIRRARIALTGRVGRYFAFKIQPQLTPDGLALLDAYVDARLFDDALVLRVGKMKTPLGIEMLQSVPALVLPERGLSTSLVPLRDVGAQAMSRLADGAVELSFGVFGGAPDGANPDGNVDDEFDVAGRAFGRPFAATGLAPLAGLGVGVAAGWGVERGTQEDGALPRWRTVTRDTFARYGEDVAADGPRYRINPQLYWTWGPVGVMAEYVMSAQRVRHGDAARTLRNEAWIASASWLVTGEDAAFGGPTPARDWGAVELGARYGELHLDEGAFAQGFVDPATPRAARAWGVSLSWWLGPVVRAQVAFEQTRFDGEARAPENALFGRVQIAL